MEVATSAVLQSVRRQYAMFGTSSGASWLMAMHMWGNVTDTPTPNIANATPTPFGSYCEPIPSPEAEYNETFSETCLDNLTSEHLGCLRPCYESMDSERVGEKLGKWVFEQLIPINKKPIYLYQTLPEMFYDLVDELILNPLGIDGTEKLRDLDTRRLRSQDVDWVVLYGKAHSAERFSKARRLGGPYPIKQWTPAYFRLSDDIELKKAIGTSSNLLPSVLAEIPPYLLAHRFDKSGTFLPELKNALTFAAGKLLAPMFYTNTPVFPFAVQAYTDADKGVLMMDGCMFDNSGVVGTLLAIDDAIK
jgi:hypothetical protein